MTRRVIHVPHLGRDVVVGSRRCPRHLGHGVHRSARYLLRALPPGPSSVLNTPLAAKSISQVYLNDKYGCCLIAAGYHMLGIWTGNADGGAPYIAPDTVIEGDYQKICGFSPSDPKDTDRGCDESITLADWQHFGFADGTRLAGTVSINAADEGEVRSSIYLWETALACFQIPEVGVQHIPKDGGIWDLSGDPDEQNGHGVAIVGYDGSGVWVATWGIVAQILWADFKRLFLPNVGGMVYGAISPAILLRGQQKAPNGVAWANLVADFDSIGGQVPDPSPVPPATGPVTLAQAQGWARGGVEHYGSIVQWRDSAANNAARGLADHWPSETPKTSED